jgi:hypothetical protein
MRDITLGDTFYHFFTTRAFATGVPTQLAGSPVLSVLEENNVTPITAGVSVSVDRASVTGLNQATIVATGGNGYEAGKSYAIYVSTGTVGGVSVVGEVVGEFTIQASAAAVDLANGTDGLGASKTVLDALKTKADFSPAVTAGAAGGLFIAGANAATSVTTALTANITGNLSGSVGSVSADVGITQGGADKVWASATRTLTAFSTALAVSVWDVLEANIVTASSIGIKLKAFTFTIANKVDASIQAAGDFAQAAADKVWSSATRTLTAFSTALAVAVWDVLASAVAVANSIGLQIKTNLDAAVSTRLATSGYTTPPTVGAIADQVWDEAIADHLGAGSTGLALNSAGAAGDPWATAIPGAYGAGTAGKIVGDNVNATIASRMATYTQPPGFLAATFPSDPADQSLVIAATDTILARLPAALTGAGNMKGDMLAINGNATAAAVLAILNGATVVYQGTVTGAATPTTLIDSGLTQTDADWWKGRIIIFTSVLTGQATDITAFDPATDKLTFTTVTAAPTGATYVII